MNKKTQPLSPHLTIHKKMLTAVLSISHRITGIFLSIGSIALVIFLFLLAMGEVYYNFIYNIFSFFIFKIVLFFWSLFVFYHLVNGLRYLLWSFGYAMNLKTIYSSGYLVVFISFLINVFLWLKIMAIL